MNSPNGNSITPDEECTSSTEPKFDMLGFPADCPQYNIRQLSLKDTDRLRQRELKWLKMMDNWDKTIERRFTLIKNRCRKGIPYSLRARAWQYLCKSDNNSIRLRFASEQKFIRYKDDKDAALKMYHRYLNANVDPQVVNEIRQDVGRQFPTNQLFSNDEKGIAGKESLANILIAFANARPRTGYCQGQGPVATFLLMHMPEHEAFWTLIRICDQYICGYFDEGLRTLRLDADILMNLIKYVHPKASKMMKEMDVRPAEFMIEWFMCLFTRTFPWPTCERIWDMFFCEGVKVLFRVALVLIKECLPNEVLKTCTNKYDILIKLKSPPARILKEDYLVEQCKKLSVNEFHMEKEHRKQLKNMRRCEIVPGPPSSNLNRRN